MRALKILPCVALALAAGLATAAKADFEPIRDGSEFTQAVAGKSLTRFGIRLKVSSQGDIDGNAFGRPVSGEWTWQNGYFCRDLFWGDQELGYNCQQVERKGAALRFTSDRGAGHSAELTLE
jgi:hypothetical protein